MKIRDEQKALAEEQEISKTLEVEIETEEAHRDRDRRDREKYGDNRRTQIVEREAAQAIDESQLITNEPVTVLLSTGGFARAAKGHEIDVRAL